MIRFFILLSSFFTASFGFGQPVQLKAYVQSVSPGTIPKGVTDENGHSRKTNSGAKDEYYVYLLYHKKTSVTPVEIWLNGEAFAIHPKTIYKTPVQLRVNKDNKNITLVAKTNDKVVQLMPLPLAESKTTAAGKEKAQTNEVVVVYKWKGKFYSITQKNLTRLEPVANE